MALIFGRAHVVLEYAIIENKRTAHLDLDQRTPEAPI